MLIFFRNNHQVSRNFDYTNEGFSPIPLNKIDQNKDFTWNIALFQDLLAVFSSIFLASIANGIIMVLVAVRLEHHVKNEILIGLSTITQIGAGVVFSRFLPSFGHKIGLVKSIILASFIAGLCSILLFKFINYWLWILIIYCYGTSMFTSSVTRNTTMIDLTPPQIRSIIISIGSTLVAIGNGIGPILLKLLNSDDSIWSFALASFLFTVSAFPLLRLKKVDSIVREQKKIAIWRYIKNSPKIFASAFTGSFIMSSCSAFSIVYGIKLGMPQNEASMLLTALLFGTIFFIPIGILCNILNRRFVMICSAFCSLAIIYLIYNYSDSENILLLFFCLFGSMSGLKLPAIILINEKYQSSQRLIVTSAFTRIALIGTICGLLNTGLLMKTLGISGIWISISSVLILFIIFWISIYVIQLFKKQISLSDLSIFYKKTNDPLQTQ
ncbi:MAG: MFS transporter [Proteobacteria bacterium]|nr:MFS transporter [Pseudomonadota bacterium]NCA28874.1 MFS transporter [Pseudomonadota bacterium]